MTADERHFDELLRLMRQLGERRIEVEHELAQLDFRIRNTEQNLNHLIRHGITEEYSNEF